jgi:hypothetical protein
VHSTASHGKEVTAAILPQLCKVCSRGRQQLVHQSTTGYGYRDTHKRQSWGGGLTKQHKPSLLRDSCPIQWPQYSAFMASGSFCTSAEGNGCQNAPFFRHKVMQVCLTDSAISRSLLLPPYVMPTKLSMKTCVSHNSRTLELSCSIYS